MKANRKCTRTQPSFAEKARVLALAALATLLGAPAHAAVDIPSVPLQTAINVPPNIMFILDDSTSMQSDFMPSDEFQECDIESIAAPSETPGSNQSGRNRYISCKTYVANTLYYNPNISYRGWQKHNGTFQTTSPENASFHDYLSATPALPKSLYDKDRVFFVPKTATATSVGSDYYWYELTSKTTARQCTHQAGDVDDWTGAGRCSDIAAFDWSATGGPQRTLAQEWLNYAYWYSFHRTRMKAAKAAASYAFYDLGSDVRVGYTDIHGHAGSFFGVPVTGNDDGRFVGDNKEDWFTKLFAEDVPGAQYTPLRTGLAAVGEYYMGAEASGPWGPETGDEQLSCRQNFAVLTTDGYWNKQDEDWGEVGDDGVPTLLTLIGNADGDAGAKITGPGGAEYQYMPGAPYSDSFEVTLADVAMHYWKTDLRTLLNNVPSSPAFWQHMVTFGISLGVRGTLDPSTDLPLLASDTKFWPDPDPGSSLGKEEGIDDLWHATVNSRGTFVAAASPEEFSRGLEAALADVARRIGSASNVAVNSASINIGTFAFQATYLAGAWTGELAAIAVTAEGLADESTWRASNGIPADPDERSIFTWNAGGEVFSWANLSAGQKAALKDEESILAYIAGDATEEIRNGGKYRNRNGNLLGDIVNSSPVYVADTKTIYAGANDGMLHAFDVENDGAELFAYVPGGIDWNALATLASPEYGRSASTPHRYFVDGSIAVSNRIQTPDRNILIGALGRGGKGVFALDVTNPAAFTEASPLWELTTGDDIGVVLGAPLVTRVHTNGSNASIGAALIGNGVNSTDGNAVLLVRNIITGDEIWAETVDSSADNGLFAPRGWDDDDDGIVDFVYAGDLKGNLWKFDMSSDNASSWTSKKIFTTQTGQPITGPLSLAKDPATGKRWVFFGTGQYITEADPESLAKQSFYGIIDSDELVVLTDLQQRSIVATGTSSGKTVRGFQANEDLDPTKKGWYLDWPGDGASEPAERSISGSFLRGGALIIPTIIPAVNPCDPGGTGFINALDAFSGTSVGADSYFDLDRDGRFDDETLGGGGDGETTVPVGSVDFGIGMPTLPKPVEHVLVGCGSSGTCADPFTPGDPVQPRRIGWREILRD